MRWLILGVVGFLSVCSAASQAAQIVTIDFSPGTFVFDYQHSRIESGGFYLYVDRDYTTVVDGKLITHRNGFNFRRYQFDNGVAHGLAQGDGRAFRIVSADYTSDYGTVVVHASGRYNAGQYGVGPTLFFASGAGVLNSGNTAYSDAGVGAHFLNPLEGSFDNFKLAVVPEPAVWLTIISGFAVLGWAMRRRRKMPAPNALASLAPGY